MKRVVPFIGTTTPTRGGGTPRGQTTIELLAIVAVALVILTVLVGFTNEQVSNLQKQRAVKTAELAVQTIVATSNELYTQGAGASRLLNVTWPDGVSASDTYIQDHSLVVGVYGTQITGTAVPLLTGTLPTSSGLQPLRIRAMDGFVIIGISELSASPSSVSTTLARDTNASTPITLTNLSSSNATLSITSTWNNTDVNLSTVTTGTISSGSTFVFDANLYANSSAVGTYTGKITVRATFPSRVETLVIPVQANVYAGNPSSLVAFPSSLSLSTFGIDTNSTTFELCNTGTTDLKTVTITPASSSPGTWLDVTPVIDTLSAQTCQTIDVNLSVPTDTLGSYPTTLSISDYTGANSLSIPTTISVLGMSSVFSWDWSPSVVSVQSIFDFTLANTGRKPVTLSQVTIRQWTQCDQEQSVLNGLVINGTSRFSGSTSDGNAMNITDFNLPTLTSYTNNSLSFSDDISDDNEAFVAVVDFLDGTQYTSSTFGIGCASDTTPPSMVSDLQARPGPEPKSITISFTMPGDDGNVGRPYSIAIKRDNTIISSQAAFNSANDVNYLGTLPYPAGGTTYTQTVTGINLAVPFYFAVQATDENGNVAPLSNTPVSKTWNEFSWAGNDFNFGNFVETFNTSFPLSSYDVNQFDLHNISAPAATQRKLVMSVSRDVNINHGWIVSLDMNSTDVNFIQIWYDVSPLSDFWSQTPKYSGSASLPLSGTIDFLDSTMFPTSYRYNGDSVQMRWATSFRVHVLENLTDFNIAADGFNGGGGGV